MRGSLPIVISIVAFVTHINVTEAAGSRIIQLPFMLPSKGERWQEYALAQLAVNKINTDATYPFSLQTVELAYNGSQWLAVQQFCSLISQSKEEGVFLPDGI